MVVQWLVLCIVAAATLVRIWVKAAFCCRAAGTWLCFLPPHPTAGFCVWSSLESCAAFLQPRQLAGCRQKYSRKIIGKCPRATYFMPKLSWLQEGSTGLQWASDTKSSWRMRWQNSEKCSSTPDIKKLPWPSYEPGLLQPQCIELTTIRPQRTTGLQLQTGPTVCLSDAERERKSLPGTSKKVIATSPLH